MRDDTIDVTNSILVGMMWRLAKDVVLYCMNVLRAVAWLWTGRAAG